MVTPAQEMPNTRFRPVPSTHKDSVRFRHVEDLCGALEECSAFHDGTIIRNYGPSSPTTAGPRTGDEMAASRERIMRQNKAIDRAMGRLAVMAPLSYRLVYAYYRRLGPSGTPTACQVSRACRADSADHPGRRPYLHPLQH